MEWERRIGHEPFSGNPLPDQAVFDPAVGKVSRFGRDDQRLQNRMVQVVIGAADEHDIGARRHGLNRRSPDGIPVRDCLHLQVVGDDQAIEGQVPTQPALYDRAREGGRSVLVEGRHEEVRNHDGSNAGIDRSAERREVHRGKAFGRVFQERKVEVRVNRGVTVPREVLAARGHALRLELVDDGSAQPRHEIGRLAERPVANCGIGRVRQHVEHGREVERDAHERQLACERPREPAREGLVAASPQHCHWRPLGEGRPQPCHPAALLVHGNPRHVFPAQLAKVVHEFCYLFGRDDVPREENVAGKVELARKAAHLLRDDVAAETNHDETAHPAGESHPSSVGCENRVQPRGHYNGPVELASSAPTRIDLAGGTIDIWPLYLFHDGAQTLNAAISLRAHVRLSSRDDERVVIESIDTGSSIEVNHWTELSEVPDLPLVTRLLSFFRAGGLNVSTRAESPAGAGIAGSSALNVALAGALARWTGASFGPEELLEIAMNVEAQVIGVPTGVQDYRPALYGGVAAVELGVDGVRRVELDVDPGELERRIVLVFTGTPRNSGTNNWEIMRRHIDGDVDVFDGFERIRDTARRMREALEKEDWDEVGRQIGAEWENRKLLAPGVTTPFIETMIGRACSAGAQAAKICGAGGGGCLFCWCRPADREAVGAALADAGAQVLDFRIEREGLVFG